MSAIITTLGCTLIAIGVGVGLVAAVQFWTSREIEQLRREVLSLQALLRHETVTTP